VPAAGSDLDATKVQDVKPSNKEVANGDNPPSKDVAKAPPPAAPKNTPAPAPGPGPKKKDPNEPDEEPL